MRVSDLVDTAGLPFRFARHPFTLASYDAKALTKSLPPFWFSDSPQDSLKTALSRFINKNFMAKIGLI